MELRRRGERYHFRYIRECWYGRSERAYLGTYTVNPDETGTITLAAIPGAQAAQTFVFVITDGGSGLLLLQTNRLGDGVLYGTARRQ